jgi:hypothetical protein
MMLVVPVMVTRMAITSKRDIDTSRDDGIPVSVAAASMIRISVIAADVDSRTDLEKVVPSLAVRARSRSITSNVDRYTGVEEGVPMLSVVARRCGFALLQQRVSGSLLPDREP